MWYLICKIWYETHQIWSFIKNSSEFIKQIVKRIKIPWLHWDLNSGLLSESPQSFPLNHRGCMGDITNSNYDKNSKVHIDPKFIFWLYILFHWFKIYGIMCNRLIKGSESDFSFPTNLLFETDIFTIKS